MFKFFDFLKLEGGGVKTNMQKCIIVKHCSGAMTSGIESFLAVHFRY